MTATMPVPVFLDLTHTSHTRARTGIQRVTRSLHAALGANAIALTHDPYLRAWRPLEPWEQANLQADTTAGKRGAHWPFSAKLQGHAGRLLGRTPSFAAQPSSGIVVPEVFSPTVALGIDRPPPPVQRDAPNSSLPVILSVGSIEGRKNHLALLEACERLWTAGLEFQLHLIGLAHPQTGQTALARIRELQARGRPLRYDGPATDAGLEAAYAACAFTVYPSIMEGFGLPVIESVARGKPCICSARGAVGESARDGGCIALERVGADELASTVRNLLADPAGLAALQAAALARPFRSWENYAADLREWLRELPHHA